MAGITILHSGGVVGGLFLAKVFWDLRIERHAEMPAPSTEMKYN